jgi:hypothetical protein
VVPWSNSGTSKQVGSTVEELFEESIIRMNELVVSSGREMVVHKMLKIEGVGSIGRIGVCHKNSEEEGM